VSEIEVITKSRLAAFSACQRLHHLTYNEGYRPLAVNEAIDFGSLFHAGLDAWWGAYQRNESLLALSAGLTAMVDFRVKTPGVDDAAMAKAEVMLAAYDARWALTMSEWEVLGVEVEFVAVIRGRKRLRIAGKLDKLVRKVSDGSIWFVEHKTTGADLSAGSTYWQRLRMDPQVSIYFGGCRELGHEPAGCLYDVVDRPDLRPLKATPPDKRKYTKEGRLYAKQRDRDETLDEYRQRLADKINETPDAFFARPEVVRLESELSESVEDVTETALQIRKGPETGVAPRNPAACFLYNRPCAFLDVCSGVASLDDETRFRRADTPHEELSLKPNH
jgi:hypothetical protein